MRCLVSRLRCFCAVVRYETRRPTPFGGPWTNPCCSGLAHGRKAMRHSPGPGNRRRAPGACAYVNSSCTSCATKRISATGLMAQAAAQTAQTGEGPAHHTGRIGCAMKPASLGNVHSLPSNVPPGALLGPCWRSPWSYELDLLWRSVRQWPWSWCRAPCVERKFWGTAPHQRCEAFTIKSDGFPKPAS